MKVFGNIGFFAYLAKSILSLGSYKRRIDAAKAEERFEEERELISEVCKYWSGQVVDHLGYEINIINPENLPEEGPVVYVSNHQSYADILTFLNITRHQVGFIAKEELTKVPIFADWVQRIESLFINRKDARASLKTINQGAEMLKNGYSLVIFPEGTRSQSGNMAEFKPGSLKLATKAKATIVPVTLRNTYKLFEETGKIKKNQSADVVVHEPIDTSTLDRKELSELSEKIESIIKNSL